jgi:hypothetical protein
MVVHLPSTMNLYRTLSSQGTRTVATNPAGLLLRRTERDHYWKCENLPNETGFGSRFLRGRTLSKVPVTMTSLALYGLERNESVSRRKVGEGGGRGKED